jgi:hypothetical protein
MKRWQKGVSGVLHVCKPVLRTYGAGQTKHSLSALFYPTQSSSSLGHDYKDRSGLKFAHELRKSVMS